MKRRYVTFCQGKSGQTYPLIFKCRTDQAEAMAQDGLTFARVVAVTPNWLPWPLSTVAQVVQWAWDWLKLW